MPNRNWKLFGRFGGRALAGELIVSRSKAILDAERRISDRALRGVSDHALSAARIIIGAEELLWQRVRSILRVAVAAVFFAISGLISIGANVTTVFAKKTTPDRGHQVLTTKSKRSGKHLAPGAYYRHHRLGKNHIRSFARHSAAGPMRGVASWYGKEFHNRQTASGARFDTHAMTAAHRTLPFGTEVRVTNLGNGESCMVEITDRGPFAKGRIIDLSYAAAKEIGMTETGVANVEIEIVRDKFARHPTFEDLALLDRGPVFDRIPRPSSRIVAAQLNLTAAANDDEGR